MNICENCKKTHDGKYGSGRFCSSKCARGFSTKLKRKEINQIVSKKINGRKIAERINKKCDNPKCDNIFETYLHRQKKYCCIACGNSARIITKETKDKLSKVLKEQYKNGRKVYGGNNHVPWYNYKDIKVQGTYELRFCNILDAWLEKNLIKDWEYTNDRVSYIGLDEKEHYYLIDFKIKTNNDKILYFEVKGNLTETDILKINAVNERISLIRLEDIEKYENLIGVKIIG